MGKDGSMSVRERIAMPEDAVVNTNAVNWPSPGLANFKVQEM